jgi:uncharacterized membrane protein YeaQ/YmgE (transglycosylase-associated protein family)
MDIVWFILIGLCAGWLAGQIMKEGGYGWVGDLIIGVIGAILGGFLLRLVGFASVSLLGELLTATFGAVVLIYLLRKFGRRV